jgi:hypothetical protein
MRSAPSACFLALAWLSFGWLPSSSAHAQPAIYKCVGANGSLSYSQSPCPGESTQELMQLDRPSNSGPGGAENRYASMSELFGRYRCDDIAASFERMPNRASMLNLIADLARQPGMARTRLEGLRRLAPARHDGIDDALALAGELCTIRLVNTPDEMSLAVGWYSGGGADGDHRRWPIEALLQELRDLGYGTLTSEPTSPDYYEGRFEDAGYSCKLSVYNATVEAALDISCLRDQ